VGCESCHNWSLPSANAPSFAKISLNATEHGLVTTACSTCHAVGKNFPGTVIKTQSAVNHIPTGSTTECSACHDSTTSFAAPSWTQLKTHQNSLSLSCSTCHGAGKTYLAVKTIDSKVGHVAIGAADCKVCHTDDLFKPATVGTNYHQTNPAPAGQCLTCHGPAGPGYRLVRHLPYSQPEYLHDLANGRCPAHLGGCDGMRHLPRHRQELPRVSLGRGQTGERTGRPYSDRHRDL
jgi:nitrate/TMAO reductase-like tetraheme cytochrome c subunit